MDFNNGDSSSSVVASLLPGDWPTSELLNYSAISSQTPLQNSIEIIAPTVLVVIYRHGSHRKRRSFIIALVSVTAGKYLLSRCPETSCIAPFIKNLLP
jgi:hypothetical protein